MRKEELLRKRCRRVLWCAFLASALGGSGSAAPQEPPFTLRGPGVDPADFRITVFAAGLNYPKGMQRLPDGALLVATSDPRQGSQGFYSSTGTLRVFLDSDLDGTADDEGTVVFSGLPGSLSGLRLAGPLVFVVSTAVQISVLRMGETSLDGLELEGTLLFTLPGSWLHPPSDLAVRPTPGAPGSYDLFFQLGSRTNFAASTQTATLGGDLGVGGALQGDSIYRVTITDHGDRVTGSGLKRIASGLRNPAGFAFHPGSGDLYFQDNGIDGLSDPNEPHSADELNVISASALEDPVEDFGFPGSYVAYRTGVVVGGAGVPPLVAFQPLPDPLTGKESEGAAEIAFAPSGFPEGLRNGIFTGFHGKFNQGGLQNEENPLVFVDLSTLDYFHWIGVDEPGVGHLDGLLATEDSLFVADLTASGSLNTGAGRGIIYQIQALRRPLFLRGDSNWDGAVDVSDVVNTLLALFGEAAPLPCLDAADANDDGEVDLSDPVAVILDLFLEGRDLPPPREAKGEDPTGDGLGCGAEG